jgi:hypothetical protein
MLDKTIKQAYSVDVAISNSHRPHSTITENLQKQRVLKEEQIRIWQMEAFYIIPLVLSKVGKVLKLHAILKLFNLRPALYILIQQAPILKYIPYSLNVFGRKVNEECLVSGIHVFEEKQLNSYKVRKVNDDGDDDDNNDNNHNNQLYYFSDFGG